MTEKLNPSTPNNDVGLYWKTSQRVLRGAETLPAKLPELVTGIIATLAGTVVWVNEEGENQITPFEAGQWQPCAAIEILLNGTVRGQAESTTATGLYWTASPLNIGKV